MAKAKQPAKSKSPSKAKKPPATAAHPSIDAAVIATAAAMVAHKVSTAPAAQASGGESASFRNLKQSLNKPHSQIMGGLLDKAGPAGQKKSSVPFTGRQQVGHNQTMGSDANRKNVPRRTAG